MKKFIVYNENGQILRTGTCQNSIFFLQAGDGEFVMEGIANDATQKVEFDGFDEKGQPINPRVVDKTIQEIIDDTPKPLPIEKRTAHITNEQWQTVLNRLDRLEISLTKTGE